MSTRPKGYDTWDKEEQMQYDETCVGVPTCVNPTAVTGVPLYATFSFSFLPRCIVVIMQRNLMQNTCRCLMFPHTRFFLWLGAHRYLVWLKHSDNRHNLLHHIIRPPTHTHLSPPPHRHAWCPLPKHSYGAGNRHGGLSGGYWGSSVSLEGRRQKKVVKLR